MRVDSSTVPNGSPPRWRRRAIELAATVAVAATLLALTLHFVDMQRVADGLRKIGVTAALLATFLMLVQVVLCALRWMLITRLTPTPLPLGIAMRGYLEAAFVNAFLPSLIASDGTRMVRAVAGGASPTQAFVGVATDRLVALCALALASATGLLLLPDASRHPLIVLALVGLLPAFVVGLVVLDILGRTFVRFQHSRIVRPFLELASLMERLRSMPGLTLLVLMISLAGQALLAGTFYVLARQLDLGIGYWPMFALSAPIIVYSAVPISVGGWGVREALSAALFGLIGVAPASGVALSIAFGLVISAVGLFCGALALIATIRSRTLALQKAAQS
ncbi:lysylphosphatidylglycerol synthase transmembrane domain-containing protein [Pseudorhodoplanes sp.]|uniref:lysylphosphatidylglycerol synthase transmembrane domain-containing protein n=1 Tax=Pseudorhodoplanes sp. TaxID=1934341 RepID=UPI002D1D4379|nr:lysylphosphatidylglycerol synthase transmembrane domain-containing protein [Pseudorhodoplanes sp.]HWV54424.1 lysylphosphatidylglycerol synthase transmembrane domain-containing protein [Pseudorhodoplanes sp.]